MLDFVPTYLVDGSIICFDDYYNYKGDPEQGEQKALAEFLQKQTRVRVIPYMDYAPLGKIVYLQGNEVSEGFALLAI